MCESLQRLMMQSAKAKNYLISHKLRPKQGWDTVKYNSSLQKDSLKNKLNKLKVWIKKSLHFTQKKPHCSDYTASSMLLFSQTKSKLLDPPIKISNVD